MRSGWVLSCVVVAAACASPPGVTSRQSETALPGSTTSAAPTASDSTTSPTAPTSPTSPPPLPGSALPGLTATADGVGDLLFPELGNPGIDVLQYDLALSYDSVTDRIEGTVGIDLVLTEDRAQITLDSTGPQVSSVTVDRQQAKSEHDGPELRIDLPEPRRAGDQVRIVIAYEVDPRPTTSAVGLPSGWFNTPGGSYVLNEPDGARSWFPCNDHPSDKATYTFTIAVPDGVTAVANGDLVEQSTTAGTTTWVWQQDRPMATYLILLLTGDYELISSTTANGLPLIHAVLRADREVMQPYFDITPEMIAFYEDLFGPYPLDRYGLAFTDSFGGLAMETQERSLFSREDYATGELGFLQHVLLAHELVHQYFGNAVSPGRWQDIWLNESFATYGEWMWMEQAGFEPLESAAAGALAQRPPGSTGRPAVEDLFTFNSYSGGAVVLHALRLTVGDDVFFDMLRRWAAENNGASRTTEQFIEFAERVSGRSLSAFFDEWLFAEQPPSQYPPGAG